MSMFQLNISKHWQVIHNIRMYGKISQGYAVVYFCKYIVVPIHVNSGSIFIM